MNLYYTGILEGHIKNFNFRGVGAPGHPSGGRCQVYSNIAHLKAKFHFVHILIINEDILGTVVALHV